MGFITNPLTPMALAPLTISIDESGTVQWFVIAIFQQRQIHIKGGSFADLAVNPVSTWFIACQHFVCEQDQLIGCLRVVSYQ
jgi:hypothetical protein